MTGPSTGRIQHGAAPAYDPVLALIFASAVEAAYNYYDDGTAILPPPTTTARRLTAAEKAAAMAW